MAASVGLDIPVQAWRHDTAYFGLPDGRATDFPIVIDDVNQVYFRPEGSEMMLVGLEAGNELGGSPDRPMAPMRQAIVEEMIARVCARVPWMGAGTLRTSHGGQDGMTPDQRPILGRAGPDGFILACGFSGTGFKTAPAVGACLAELILDGQATTVDIGAYGVERFAEGACWSANTHTAISGATPDDAGPGGSASILALSGVGVRRQGSAILSAIDWTVEAGQRWVVLGPNGAGKTTLLRIATGYLVPSDGEVELLARRMGTFDVREARASIGLAGAALDALVAGIGRRSRSSSPAPGAPSTRGGTGNRGRVGPGAVNPRAARCGALVERTYGSLSSGERQRTLIARALKLDPDLLVLDEPYAGLDIAGREDLNAAISELAAAADRGIVLVVHHLEEIRPASTMPSCYPAGGSSPAANSTPSWLRRPCRVPTVASSKSSIRTGAGPSPLLAACILRPMTEIGAGTILAGYGLERLLGRGGMGTVWLATQEALDRKVALKLLAPEISADPKFRARFLSESRLAASIDHPNIVPVFEAGEADGELFLAMRYVEGTDLDSLISNEGALAPGRLPASWRASRMPSMPPMRVASSTGTSSRPTSWSRPASAASTPT